MTTDYKVTELFCIIDEFCKHFDAENAGNLLEDNSGTKRRRRQASLSDSDADKGYISQKLFDFLFEDGIQLVTGLRVNMKNKLMPFYDRMMLRKRYIIETNNDILKNSAQIVHSRHRSVNNFVMNLISALGAYCFFDNKPMTLQGYCIEDTKQLSLF